MSRRAALWQAAAVERDPRGLFAGVEPAAGAVPLAAMDAMSETRADYAATGLTVGPHLMAHMRERCAQAACSPPPNSPRPRTARG